MSKSQREFLKTYAPALIVCLAGILISVALFLKVHRLRQEERLERFQQQVQDYSILIKNHIDEHLRTLEQLGNFIQSVDRLTRDEFHNYVQRTLASEGPDILSMNWIRYIPSERRTEMVSSIQKEGLTDFEIRELGSDGRLIDAPPDRPEGYYPIVYAEPAETNRFLLGFNMATDPTRAEAMRRACDTGAVTVSGRIRLLRAPNEEKYGCRLFMAVYDKGPEPRSVEERRRRLVGFVSAFVPVKEILEAHYIETLNFMQLKGRVNFYDANATPSERYLFSVNYQSQAKVLPTRRATRRATYTIAVDGRRWMVSSEIDDEPFYLTTDGESYLVLGLGLLVTALLVFYLFEVLSKSKTVEMEVQRRTEEIGRLMQAIGQCPLSIIITNTDGVIEFVNPFFTRITGFSAVEVVGENPRILKSGEQPDEYYRNLWQTIKAGREWRGEFHNRKKNGHLYWESALISPVKNSSGEITHFIAVKEDITEKKRMEDEIRQAMQRKLEFMSVVSHELRTPLAVIKESIALVADGDAGPVNAEQKEFIDRAKSNIDRLGRLINNVLDYQKLDSEHTTLLMTLGDVNAAIREVVSGFEVVAAKKNLKIVLDLQNDLPKITFDKDKIIQVLTNYLNNAVKFTPTGTIKVSSRAGGNVLRVAVSDQGPGILPEDQPKLFHSFTQVNLGAGRAVGGTGLGLAISKKIIELHHGTVGLESKPPDGATFFFVLPIVERRSV